jgi:hypothetical protein
VVKPKVVPVTARGYTVGERHHRAKLTDDDVRLILALRAEGVPQRQVAEKFECSRRTVRDIEAGLSRCALPDRCRAEKLPRRVEKARVLASRWPCRIKPAKPDEFEVIPHGETACGGAQAVSENAS